MKKYYKNMKIIIPLIVLIAIGEFLVLFYFLQKSPTTNQNPEKNIIQNTETQIFKTAYESLNDGVRPHVEVTDGIDVNIMNFDELKKTLENGDGIVFFGFPTCPWCRHMLPVLFDAMEETGVTDLYYYNPKEIRNTLIKNENWVIITENPGTKEYEYILHKLDKILPEYKGLDNKNIKRLYVPFVVIVKNGEILSSHLSTLDDHTDSKTNLTDEQKTRLKNIFIEMIQPLKTNLFFEPCNTEKEENEPC